MCGSPVVLAQDVTALMMNAKEKLDKGSAMNDIMALKEASTLFERAANDVDNAVLAHYYLGLVSYRLAGTSQDKGTQLEHLNRGIAYLEKAVELDEQFAEGYGLMGSMLGWKAGLKPMQSMFLGPKSNNMLAKGMEIDPDNPRLKLFQAISSYNTPPMFGGDKKKAKESFARSAELFAAERNEDVLAPSWGEEEAYAWLGQALMAEEAYPAARESFEKALAVNPDYGWVKYVLMPKLQEAEQKATAQN